MCSRPITLLVSLTVTVVGIAAAEKPPATNEDKIIGVWEFSQKEGMAEITYTTEFLKDGKLKGTMRMDGETKSFSGTYELDADTLTMFNAPGADAPFLAKGSVTNIKKLTDKMLVLEQKIGDSTKTITFKRK